MRYNRILLQLIIIIGLFAACRKQWSATEEDMANYGWSLYEQGDYVTSYEWFSNAIIEDKSKNILQNPFYANEINNK